MEKYSRPVAYHEAGHVVAARSLGIPIHSVAVIKRHGERLAGTGGRTRTGGSYRSNDITEMVFLYAGPVAEARYTKRDLMGALFNGYDVANSDIHRIAALSKEFPDPAAVDHLAYGMARRLVKEEWSNIAALAERLVREGVVQFEGESA